MSCENCAITINRIIGSPASYKIRFANYPAAWDANIINGTKQADNAHDPTFTNPSRGSVIAQNITNSALELNPLVIPVGGPVGSNYSDFWADSNTIVLRIENQDNPNCFYDRQFQCETTATTQAVPDCCDGMTNIIETHGYTTNEDAVGDAFAADTITDKTGITSNAGIFEQQRINLVRTVGFNNGTFDGAIGFVPGPDGLAPDPTVGDGTGIQIYPGTTQEPGTTGKICYGKVTNNKTPIGEKFVIVKTENSLTSGNLITTGYINIQGDFQDGESSLMVYTHTDGLCYSGDIKIEATSGVVIFSPHTP